MNPVVASIQAPVLSVGLQRLLRPVDLAQSLIPLMAPLETEHFCGIATDASGNVVEAAVLSIGTDVMTLADPRILLRWALTRKTLVHSVYWAHNHPSGDPTPSQPDISLTYRLLDACNMVGIVMRDHLVIAGHHAVSIERMAYLVGGPR